MPVMPRHSILRFDLFVIWGRAVANAVGYTADEAKALGVAWAYRRTDSRRQEPRSGFQFAGYVFHRCENRDGSVSFTAHGAFRSAADYAEIRARVGEGTHDAILSAAADLLYDEPIERLDGTKRSAELLHALLTSAGIGTGFRHVQYDAIVAALVRRRAPRAAVAAAAR